MAILSLAVYLIASCGIVINSHYCMKRLVAVRVFESKADACARCGMTIDKDNHCCHDEVKMVKMINDQNRIPVMLYDLSSFSPASSMVSEFLIQPILNGASLIPSQGHSPPLISLQDIYIKNRVFRI